MALTMTLLALLPTRPAGARSVLWPRIDQKTCLKAITAAGLTPVVLEMQLVGDELRTDLQVRQDPHGGWCGQVVLRPPGLSRVLCSDDFLCM